MNRKTISIRLIAAIQRAAIREGGIHNISMPGKKKRWRECVALGFLWYNAPSGTTRVVKI